MTDSMLRFIHRALLGCLLALPLALGADEHGENGESGEGEPEGKQQEAPKTIAQLTENADRHEGLFTLFRDRKTGETSMLVRADQLGREHIYWVQVSNGLVDAGFIFRGAYGPTGVFTIERRFDKLEIVQRNTAFYFDPESPLARASEANISDAVLAVEKILAEDEASGDLLIKADGIFASEALIQIRPTPNPDADPKTTFALGKLDNAKTKVLNLRSYPQNTDVEVEYVYHNPEPKVYGSAAVTDARNVSLRVVHSFIEMPDNDYRPRLADPRIGFFDFQVTDLTSHEATPYRDVIRRWHLVKKDPGAELSEPVEPITWWIENTTPLEWRDLIRDAALEWNKAFESAGFKNAMVVKVQPDDADWDAGDIRYNVLRWTSSPNPPFGGYGPHFANPRTGQVLGADVMLEYAFMSRFSRARNLIQEDPALAAPASNPNFAPAFCSLGHAIQTNTAFARTAAAAAGYGAELEEQLVHDTMHYLILHEIGHTLGMNHNMKATHLLTPEEAFDPEAVARQGLAGSVMDYPAVNFAPSPEQQTLFYQTEPGSYDHWFIEYGYSTALDDAQAEAERLEAILARSTEPQLVFGNDADDMRSPGKAIDPRVNIYDMSSNPVAYASGQMALMQDTLNRMAEWTPEAGKSYEETWEGVGVMLNLWSRSAQVVSRYIGGVYVDRAMVGQDGAAEPFQPVAEDDQREAMKVLAEQVFAPGAFRFPDQLLRRTARERRGFDHSEATEDPKVHDAVLAIQKGVLDHLLHPVVLKRISDSELYGNGYELAAVINDLTDAIFAADARGNVNGFRQQLQLEYVTRLAAMVNGEARKNYHYPAQSMALYSLNSIQDLLARKRNVNAATAAHTQHLQLAIERALSTEA